MSADADVDGCGSATNSVTLVDCNTHKHHFTVSN